MPILRQINIIKQKEGNEPVFMRYLVEDKVGAIFVRVAQIHMPVPLGSRHTVLCRLPVHCAPRNPSLALLITPGPVACVSCSFQQNSEQSARNRINP